jgi:ABC-type cobalamin transport system permease subunit
MGMGVAIGLFVAISGVIGLQTFWISHILRDHSDHMARLEKKLDDHLVGHS